MQIKNFLTLQGHNCILGNVFNAMNYFHVDVTEQDLFFWFSPFDGDRNLPEVFEKLYEDKGEYGWQEFVKLRLNDERPVLISINPKVLPYVKVEVGYSSAMHYINIIGIDEETKQLYVSDSYIPTYVPSTYEGWVDFSEISDFDIGNCWCLKSELLFYLQSNYRLDNIKSYTLAYVIKRLRFFLGENSDDQNSSGIEKLQILKKNVRNNVESCNYNEIFRLLAGIKLNVITPLIYLVNALECCMEGGREWIVRLNNLVNGHWESLNIKLIKFALAHKKLDKDKVSEQIDEAVKLEKEVLNDILNRLLEIENGDIDAISAIL